MAIYFGKAAMPAPKKVSSRTFRYGYLVTTSPQLSSFTLAAPCGYLTDFG